MSEKALVTVYMPTRNRSATVGRAISSVLGQSYENLELIIVDDASSDNTASAVQGFRDSRLIYLRQNIPLGACAARNLAIQRGRGFYVAGIDDDDEWLPNRIEQMLASYDPSAAFIFSDDYVVGATGAKRTARPSVVNFRKILDGNLVGNQIFCRMDQMRAIGAFDETLPSAQDYDLWIRLLHSYGSAKKAVAPSQIVYQTALSISTGEKRWRGYFRVYRKNRQFMTNEQRVEQLREILISRMGRATSRQIVPLALRPGINGRLRFILRCRFPSVWARLAAVTRKRPK